MKYTSITCIAFFALASLLKAEGPFDRDLKGYREERDKALSTAAEPINRRYKEQLEQLLKRATQAIDLEAAIKTKNELQALGVSSPDKPTAAVPSDAKLFNGKWYRVYLDQTTWPLARDKCKTLGGQLAVVPDEPTHAFLKELKPDVGLWLGATDERLEGAWMWVDGTEMKFKAWMRGEPAGRRAENYLFLIHGAWEDHSNGRPQVIGYISEWKAK